MSSQTVFKELMRTYEKDRDAAFRLSQKRQQELYEKNPRLAQIDRELSLVGLELTKLVLSGKPSQSSMEQMQQKNKQLLLEKSELMEELGVKADFMTDCFRCSSCQDTGFVGNQKCKCLKQRLIETYHRISNLGKVLTHENFDTFNLQYYSDEIDPKKGVSPQANIKRVWTVCLQFVKQFDTQFDNLLFYGSTGLGKTFLCNCIAKELLDQGKTVFYVTAAQVFKMLEEFRFNRKDDDEPEEYTDLLIHSDLLIIDDLGTEFSTMMTSSELFNFINIRLLNRKHTIISTNLSPSDFEDQYSDRITSRLLGHYRLLQFFGDDIRLKKKYNM